MMNYKIEGGNLPVLLCRLEAGESMMCEGGSMSWMDDEIEMQTQSGGLGKMFSKMITGESVFQNRYVAKKAGEIAFASSFPGSIRALEVAPGRAVIAQKGSFLACSGDINISIFFQKKARAGFFGGEGFVMQKFEGSGIVFLEIDGSAIEYDIAAGDRKIVDTGHLAAMDASCTIDIQSVKGVKNVLFGGEGLFNTVVNGPGHIILQTMPIQKTAMEIYNYLPQPQSSN